MKKIERSLVTGSVVHDITPIRCGRTRKYEVVYTCPTHGLCRTVMAARNYSKGRQL